MAVKKAPTGFLADTGIWVEVERGRLSAADLAAIIGKVPVYGSPVSIAELSQATELPPEEHVRARRRATVQRLLGKVILPIDAATGEVFGKLAFGLVKAGRGSPTHRVQDIWLAAQAIQHRLRLITYNRKDFDDVPGLDVQVLTHEPSPVSKARRLSKP
jgi:predicted nucleic acid-binding protein